MTRDRLLPFACRATPNRQKRGAAMAKSNAVARPNKPRHDFPLAPRGDGRWCKRVNGKLEYFTGTAKEALDEWIRVKDALMAGRPRPPIDDGRLTVGDLVNHF